MKLEIDQKFFFDLLEKFERGYDHEPKIIPRADSASSYSDIQLWRVYNDLLEKGKDARLVVLAMSMLPLNPIQEEDLKTKVIQVISHYAKMGGKDWRIALEMAYLQPFTPFNVLKEHMKTRSSQDFHGNEVEKLYRIYHHGLQPYNPYLPSKKKVKPSKRKRGYDDKGHLPGTFYGMGNTTERIPEKKEDDNFRTIPVSNTTYWESFLPEVNFEQLALVESSTSSNFQEPDKIRVKDDTIRSWGRSSLPSTTPLEDLPRRVVERLEPDPKDLKYQPYNGPTIRS